MALVPVKDFQAEEVTPGVYVCKLVGGQIKFSKTNQGKWDVEVSYENMSDWKTYMGSYATLSDAGYRLTHGVIPQKLAKLLLRNGILARKATI